MLDPMKDDPSARSAGSAQSLAERAEGIFHGALQLPAEQRAGYLKMACGENAELLKQVEILLEANEKAGGFLEEPAAASPGRTVMVPVSVTEKAGDKIGRYKLLQQIGEGGCGVVYMAEQEEPVRRRVALKVIKLGMDTKSVIARFEAERQALALMDHPNIAKVLDAGATETGAITVLPGDAAAGSSRNPPAFSFASSKISTCLSNSAFSPQAIFR